MGRRRSVVQIVVSAAEAELAADALWQAGPTAVGEVDLGDDRIRLTADVSDPSALDARWNPTVVPEGDDEAHLDAWRSWRAPLRAGRRFVLHPAWVELRSPRADDLVVVLDPGRAFGSGSHESTRLCLTVLEDAVQAGATMLDVGCGSGVLSIGACLLGAHSVTAVDVDREAVRATSANAEINGVADRISVSTTPVAAVSGRFDLVVANISAATVRELAGQLEAHLADGGTLVLAGMLEEQGDDVVAAFAACTEVERRSEAGWSVLVLRGQTSTKRSTGPDSSRT